MLRPARMVYLEVLVLDSDVDRATTQMIKSGLVHLVSVTDLEPWADERRLQAVADEDSETLTQVEKLARSIAEKLEIGTSIVSEALAFQAFDIKDARKKLEQMAGEVQSVVATRDSARQRLADLHEARSRLAVDVQKKFGVDVSSRYTLLEVVLGRLPEKNLDAFRRLLSAVPNVVLTFPEEKGKAAVMAIVLKRDAETLRGAVEDVGLEKLAAAEKKPAFRPEVMAHLDEYLQKAEDDLKKAELAVEAARASNLNILRAILSQVGFQKLKGKAKSTFRKTARTYLISGWTPRRKHDEVIEALKKACENRCLIEEQSAGRILFERAGQVDVPILFENPKALKPFEMLVSNYGRPAYNSIDPTLVVAPTFLLMYGMMFGDLGQGLVMAILGALVSRWKKVEKGIRQIGELFTWCGGAAMVFGLIYGSLFGVKLYRGLEPLANVTGFLNFALFFGMSLISLGLLFNVAAAITRRDWVTGLLDRTGLMGLAFYWLAVAAVAQILSGQRVNRTVVTVLVLMPVAAVFLKGPIGKLLHRREDLFEHGVASYVVRSVGEVFGTYFESFLTFLSNTVSFLRIAAFAMAHAALFAAIFSLADVVRGGGAVPPIAVHVVGNAVTIALEGLVVCVQALRLQYYEFFGKFYQAGGTAFAPTKLPATVP